MIYLYIYIGVTFLLWFLVWGWASKGNAVMKVVSPLAWPLVILFILLISSFLTAKNLIEAGE